MRLLTGLRAWTAQRISALVLLVVVPAFAAVLLASPPVDAAAWRAFVARPAVGAALALGFAALLVHAWVGVRDVVLDYVPVRALRALVLVAVAAALGAAGAVFLLALAALHLRPGPP
jgi:succinate dehydrogenase / fumarate reductase membrane anchor subunit